MRMKSRGWVDLMLFLILLVRAKQRRVAGVRPRVVVLIFVMSDGIVAMGRQCTCYRTTCTSIAPGHRLGLRPHHGGRGWDEGPGPKSRGRVGASLGVGEVAGGEEGGGCELMDHFGHEIGFVVCKSICVWMY